MEEQGGAERRRYQRIACQIPVRYRLKAQGVLTSWKESEAGNISAGGLFVTFGEKMEKGMLLDLEIPVPGLVGPLKTLGKVVWVEAVASDKIVKCGLEFAQIRAEDRAFLSKYIERQSPSGDE